MDHNPRRLVETQMNLWRVNINTPLMQIAKINDDSKMSGYLEDYPNSIDDINDYGDTALIIAAKYGNDKTVKILINHGANLNIKNDRGVTALATTSSNGHIKVVELLLTSSRLNCLNEQDNNGNTPLHLAALYGYFDVVKMLSDHGALNKIYNNYHRLANDLAKSLEINDYIRNYYICDVKEPEDSR